MTMHSPKKISSLDNETRDLFCGMLSNNGLWSESIIKKTLNRTGGQPFNVEDVQIIVKDYLGVMQDTIERGKDV